MAPLYGTEQRIYGTIVVPCKFYLDRFAIVLNDTTNDPDHANQSNVVYGGGIPRKSCGHMYDGFMSLLFNASGHVWEQFRTFGIVIEFRFCSKDNHKLIIETYGQRDVGVPVAIWFLHTKIGDPDPSKREWVQVNFCNSGILPYKKVREEDEEWKFKEDMMSDPKSVVIFCCRKCPTCECIECVPNVQNKFRVRTSRVMTGASGDLCCNNLYNTYISQYDTLGFGPDVKHYAILNKFGNESMLFQNIIIEFTLTCGHIDYWVYYDKDLCRYNEWIIVEYLTDNEYAEDDDGNEIVTKAGEWIKLYEGFSSDI